MYKLFNNIGKVKIVQIRSIPPSYGPFAIERGETAKKFFFELMLFLNIFQYKNHIWHINKNFIFLAVSPLSIAKGPIIWNNEFIQKCKLMKLMTIKFHYFVIYYLLYIYICK